MCAHRNRLRRVISYGCAGRCERYYSSTVRRAIACGSPPRRRCRHRRFTASIHRMSVSVVSVSVHTSHRHDVRGARHSRARRPRRNGNDRPTHAAKPPCPRPIIIIAKCHKYVARIGHSVLPAPSPGPTRSCRLSFSVVFCFGATDTGSAALRSEAPVRQSYLFLIFFF